MPKEEIKENVYLEIIKDCNDVITRIEGKTSFICCRSVNDRELVEKCPNTLLEEQLQSLRTRLSVLDASIVG